MRSRTFRALAPSGALPEACGLAPSGALRAAGSLLGRTSALAVTFALAVAAPALGRHPRRPHRPTVASALAALARGGAIDQATYAGDLAMYNAARASLRRLSGTRREELGAVVGTLEAMAARGLLTPSRLGVAFTTVARNREWWTTGPLLGSGQRVSVPGSHLVWEHYAGEGIQIQWLATFGQANGDYAAHNTTALKELLDEAIPLATQRAGGIAWEYMFTFDGGAPPWTSGLSQGTAVQALARAWSRTHEAAYLSAAQQALALFTAGPPTGVRVSTPAGAHYLEYTYAPSERVINGFIQSLVGLYEYAKLTGDPSGQRLFEEGDAQARAELPSFDTGAWSKYDRSSESNLNYHELVAEFLEHLCERTSLGEPLAAASGGGASAGAGSGAPASGAGAPIPGDEIYCTTAQRFRADLTTPPQVGLLTTTVHTGERAGVKIRLSKVSTVTMTISNGEKTVWSVSATVEAPTPRLLWATPAKPGEYGVELRATDLAGNEEVATGAIAVKAVKRRGRRPGKHHPKAKAAGEPRGSPTARALPTL